MIDQLVRLVTIWVQMDVTLLARHSTGKTMKTTHVENALTIVKFVLVVL